jgi:hypothetical protein
MLLLLVVNVVRDNIVLVVPSLGSSLTRPVLEVLGVGDVVRRAPTARHGLVVFLAGLLDGDGDVATEARRTGAALVPPSVSERVAGAGRGVDGGGVPGWARIAGAAHGAISS